MPNPLLRISSRDDTASNQMHVKGKTKKKPMLMWNIHKWNYVYVYGHTLVNMYADGWCKGLSEDSTKVKYQNH